ncbi:16177_t:CDS:2 [Rhizophagus irregularis]|nr:16177_t:CDS:2 [Rhizophagus irregularis]
MAKKLSLYFRNHQVPLAALRRIQKDKYGKEIGLSLPVETRWLSAYQCLDSIFKSKMAMMALLGEDIALDREIKIKILDDIFWTNLKDLQDFLLPFIIFIQQLEQDDPYLSTAFINLRKIEIQIKNNTKIPNDFNDIIEEELIRLAGEENQNLVLEEYSEFIGKCSGFSKSYLWGNIKNKPINWWHLLEKRYPLLKLNVPLTIKELVKNGVTIENSEEKEIENNIEILDDFEELNEMYLEQDLSEEIEEE